MLKTYLQDTMQLGLAGMLRQQGVEVWQSIADVSPFLAKQPGFNAIEAVDALILDITKPGAQTNFIIAHAILQQKPLLCLYQKNKEPREMLGYLQRRGLPKSLQLRAYTFINLTDIINHFLQSLGIGQEPPEKPDIKFTLRITRHLEQYLNWQAQQRKITKADYLRFLMENWIKEDEEYQQVKEQKKKYLTENF